jgi:hypothetical protein
VRFVYGHQTPTVSNRLAQSRLSPHFDGGELAQFITFRLHDALPGSVLARWKEELKHEKPGEVEAIMSRRVEAYLDQGHGKMRAHAGCMRTARKDAGAPCGRSS